MREKLLATGIGQPALRPHYQEFPLRLPAPEIAGFILSYPPFPGRLILDVIYQQNFVYLGAFSEYDLNLSFTH